MPRFLALDWDNQLLQVVEAQVGRSGVRVQRAALWKEEQSPNPAEAERQGRLLAERLKQAGIAPGPVLVAVGRDRVILKDVRFPQVPASEEPAIVRFQAAKELTFPADEVVIDYTPIGEPGPNGERRAMGLILRKELLQAYQTMCRAAGLKLAGITPRPFGTAACVKALARIPTAASDPLGPTSPTPAGEGGAVAVLTVTGAWAEFAVVRDGRLLFARSVATGDGMVGEIRRNLALYAGQPASNGSRDRVQALLVAGNGEHNVLREQLQQLLAIPVLDLDPFAGVERLEFTGTRGGFAGAVGLLHAQAGGELPIDFAHPKQPRQERDPRPARYALMGVGGLVAFIVLLVVGRSVLLAGSQREIDDLRGNLELLDNQLLLLKKDSDNLKELRTWTAGDLAWLDELDALTAKFPDTKYVHLKDWSVNVYREQAESRVPAPKGKAAPQRKPVAQITLVGEFTGDDREVNRFIQRLSEDTPAYLYRIVSKTITPKDEKSPGTFTVKIDIEPQPPVAAPKGGKAAPAGKPAPLTIAGRKS